MTAFLFALVPVALFALIAASCFVGCGAFLDLDDKVFDDGSGETPPLTKYSDTDVIGNKDCVAYWPLFDASAALPSPPSLLAGIVALDVVGNAKGTPNNGSYKSVATDPALFPCPDFNLSAGVDSAKAPGTVTVGAPGIVTGDAVQPANNPAVITNAMLCDGGFVTVPFSQVINPDPPFSIECWARPEWDAAVSAFRAVLDSRNSVGATVSGYEIGVNENNQWEARLGVTGANPVLVVTANGVTPQAATHLVLTFDGTDAALFVDGTRMSSPTQVPAGEKYSVNTAAPLVIGVGLPWLTNRAVGVAEPAFPMFPFKGTIQDVAIYKTVLADKLINTHAQNGQGKATE